MIGYEDGVSRRMACPAVDLGGCIHAPRMAILTKNRALIEVDLVPSKAELGQPIVLEGIKIIHSDNRIAPFMLRMAEVTFLDIRQSTVHTRSGEALLANIRVATFAAFGRAALPGSMALSAVRFEFGVGSKAG